MLAIQPILCCLQAADEAEAEQEEGELVEVVPEPTDEELLTQLGLQLEQQMAKLTANDELPAGIMQQWAEEELQRDKQQWHPRKQLADQDSDQEEDEGGDAAEAVSFLDIKSSILGPCKIVFHGIPCHPQSFFNLQSPPSWGADPDLFSLKSMWHDCDKNHNIRQLRKG